MDAQLSNENALILVFTLGIAVLFSVLIPFIMKNKGKNIVKLKQSYKNMKFSSLINGNRGPFGFGFLPKAQKAMMDQLLQLYLKRLFNNEIINFKDGILLCNSSVAHASENENENTMNIAMPDLSAEYWCTFVPAGQAPVIKVKKFPKWTRYCDLTAYDKTGLPISYINNRQIYHDFRATKISKKKNNKVPTKNKVMIDGVELETNNRDENENDDDDEHFIVNLMYDIPSWSGPLIILFRVYRPINITICPQNELPQYRFIPIKYIKSEQTRLRREIGNITSMKTTFLKVNSKQHDSVGYMPDNMFDTDSEDEYETYSLNMAKSLTKKKKKCDNTTNHHQNNINVDDDEYVDDNDNNNLDSIYDHSYLKQASQEQAMEAGKRIGSEFQKVISRKIKKLDDDKLGTQFFSPTSVSGLFVNRSATYVCAFLPQYLSSTSSAPLLPNHNKKKKPLFDDDLDNITEYDQNYVNILARGMRLRGCLPQKERWRAFYGFMAICYKSTATISSMMDQQFYGDNAFNEKLDNLSNKNNDNNNDDGMIQSGWGSEYVLFVAHTIEEAINYGGYNPSKDPSSQSKDVLSFQQEDKEPKHYLLLWKNCEMPGIVLRYIHYYDESSDLTSQEVMDANDERNKLVQLDGSFDKLSSCDIPGVPTIEYF